MFPKRICKAISLTRCKPVLAAVEADQQRELVLKILDKSKSRFVLGYDPTGPRALVGYLQDQVARLNVCDSTELMRVGTALSEAVTNAIEHGNLELDSALRDLDNNAYRKLGEDRAQQPPYGDRRVHITTRITPSEATYTICDEGPGFDPSTLPDPTDPENLLKPSGRGILLIRTFMDDVWFNDKGNEIMMVKTW